MAAKDDGGPAFPDKQTVYRSGYPTDDTRHVPGMTLRQYYAGQALPVLMAQLYAMCEQNQSQTDVFEIAAKASFEQADAMIRAGKK